VLLAGDAIDTCRRASNRPSTATAAARATRCTGPGGPCTPEPNCSPTKQRDRLTVLFATDDHIEVEAT